jgi:hypothetical protein
MQSESTAIVMDCATRLPGSIALLARVSRTLFSRARNHRALDTSWKVLLDAPACRHAERAGR